MDQRKLFKNILASTAYTRASTIVIQRLGINEAILLAELMTQQHSFGKERKLKDGFFYATMDFLTTATYLSQAQISAATKKIEDTWVYMHKIEDEDKYKELIAELNDSIGIIETDDAMTDDMKKEKIVELKRAAGFEKLLETDITTSYGQKIKWYKVFTKAVDVFIKAGDGSVSANVIREDAFILYNKLIAAEVGPPCAVVFSDLLTSYYYTEEKDQLEEDEWFRMVQDSQAKRLGITRKTLVMKYIPDLIKAALISKKTMGNKNATYISIIWEHLYEILGGVVIEEKEEGMLLKKVENEAEDFTKEVLAKVKEVSGQEWNFTFNRVQFIQKRLHEGLEKEDILGMIEHMYNHWQHMAEKTGLVKKYQSQFNWTRLFGSRCKENIEKMYKDKTNSEKKAELTILAEKIAQKVIDLSGGKVRWSIYDSVLPLLETQLDMGFTEDELIEFVEGRYQHKVESGSMRNFSWKGVFGETKDYSCSKCIEAMKKSKAPYNFKITSKKGTRDGVKSSSYTAEEKEKFKERAAQGESKGEQWIF